MVNYVIGVEGDYVYHYLYGSRFNAKQAPKGSDLQKARIFTSEICAKREMNPAKGKLLEIEIRIKDDGTLHSQSD